MPATRPTICKVPRGSLEIDHPAYPGGQLTSKLLAFPMAPCNKIVLRLQGALLCAILGYNVQPEFIRSAEQTEGESNMEAVITVVGQDKVGILAAVCTVCAGANVNVEEVTQRILRDTFAMIMLVDLSRASVDFTAFAESLRQKGEELGVDIRCTRQEMYDAMHRI